MNAVNAASSVSAVVPKLIARLVVLAAGAGIAVFAGRAAMRAKPRACGKCGAPMRRLGDGEKQAHLGGGEKAEENVGSMGHDVWRCTSCMSLEKARWPAIVTKVTKCGVCNFRTMKVTSKKRTSGAMVEVVRHCEFCGANETATHARGVR